jgi:hypothetical protein
MTPALVQNEPVPVLPDDMKRASLIILAMLCTYAAAMGTAYGAFEEKLAYSNKLGAEVFLLSDTKDMCQRTVRVEIRLTEGSPLIEGGVKDFFKKKVSRVLDQRCPDVELAIISVTRSQNGENLSTTQIRENEWKLSFVQSGLLWLQSKGDEVAKAVEDYVVSPLNAALSWGKNHSGTFVVASLLLALLATFGFSKRRDDEGNDNLPFDLHDTSLDNIFVATGCLEKILETKGAVGRGLHEKATSVESLLSQGSLKSIRFIASVRNKLAHANPSSIPKETKEDLLSACARVYQDIR